jgi:hypothetical protein
VTQFEYIAIAPSLILSFSLARALANLGPVFSSDYRYWVHSLLVVVLLANHISIFWAYWAFHLKDAWTVLEFIFFLLHPVGLLISTSLLLPNAEVSDYREHFETVRTPYYSVWIVTMAADPLLGFVALEFPIIHWANLPSAFIVVGFAAGIIYKSRLVDAGMALLIAVYTIVYLASVDELAENILPLMQG